ncbi:MAG: FKBP-type peptidyl-prolyl cis-trans isomerase [Candidatus Azambacteria bacterium]|nr:FKBP-type peptidyl-prolyl cis-trans isomerase [Candidatus Azambacteria bacterium]
MKAPEKNYRLACPAVFVIIYKIKNMDKNKIIALATAIVLIVVGFFIFYNKNKTDSGAVKQNETIDLKLTNQKMNGNDKLTTSKQGMEIEILKEGTGAIAKKGDTVSVHYVGVLENGTKFDSSVDRGTPFEFSLGGGQVIPGWDIGVEGMKIGEVRKLTIPSELAYGVSGAGNAIPPNATLVFEVQLLGIK